MTTEQRETELLELIDTKANDIINVKLLPSYGAYIGVDCDGAILFIPQNEDDTPDLNAGWGFAEKAAFSTLKEQKAYEGEISKIFGAKAHVVG